VCSFITLLFAGITHKSLEYYTIVYIVKKFKESQSAGNNLVYFYKI